LKRKNKPSGLRGIGKRTLLLAVMLLSMTLWIACSHRQVCPHFPRPSEAVKEELREYQDKDKHPETWAWFNDLYKLCQQLGDCKGDD